MTQRSARFAVLIFSLCVTSPLGSQIPQCPRYKQDHRPLGVFAANRGSQAPRCPWCKARLHSRPVTTREWSELFPGLQARRGFQAGEESAVG